MNLGELLTAVRQEISDTVSTLVAGQTQTDTLWSDQQLTNYLNWALNRFAARTGMLRDTTTSVTQITLVANQTIYPLDPSILEVMSVLPNGSTESLGRVDYSEIDSGANPDFAGVDIFTPFHENRPRLWSPNYGANSIMIWPAYTGYWPWNQPNGTPYPALVNMRVVRLPLKQLNPNIPTQTPEIPIQYHMDLVDGATYRALSVTDTDANAPIQASGYKSRFEEAIKMARRDVRRKYNLRPKFIVGETGSW